MDFKEESETVLQANCKQVTILKRRMKSHQLTIDATHKRIADTCSPTNATMLPSSLSPAETPLYIDETSEPLQSLNQSVQNVEPLEENGPSDNFSSCNRFTPSDINQWPVEVLSYMFERYFYECDLDFDRNAHECDLEFPRNVPLALGAVCRKWRHVVWSTPTLWTSLHFQCGKNTTKNHVLFAIEWLKRSGALPLSINIWNQGYYVRHPGETMRLLSPLLDTINRSLPRCHTLYVSRFEKSTFTRLFSINRQTKGKLLEQSIPLKLEVRPGNTSRFTLKLGSISPKEATFYNFDLDVSIRSWRNLTIFRGLAIRIDQMLHVIRHAPKLVECHLWVVLNPDPNPSTTLGDKQIIHTGLLVLDIDQPYNDRLVIQQLFQATTFPNLTTCNIIVPCEPVAKAFLSFLRRSCCAIKCLTLGLARETPCEDFIEITSALPSITELSLEFIHDSDPTAHLSLNPWFDALYLDSRYSNALGNIVLLPLLESLSIDVIDPFQWDRLPGFRHRYHYDGDTRTILPGRPSLKKLSVYRHHYSTDRTVEDDASSINYESNGSPRFLPDGLIDSWDMFSELLELREVMELDLKVKRGICKDPDNLFKLSFRKLEMTHGEAPEHIKESKFNTDNWRS